MSIRDNLTVQKILDACDPKGEWYNDDKLWATKKHWLICTSPRGYGKSTRFAIRYIAEWIVNGKKWLYLRRNDRLLKATQKSFFDGARKIINRANLGFNITALTCEAGEYRIKVEFDDEDNKPPDDVDPDDTDAMRKWREKTAEPCGLAMALSTGEEEAKSGGGKFEGIKYGIFDEFMAARATGYLGSIDDPDVEYEALYSIFVSIRDVDVAFTDDVYFVMLGNRSHDYNPILLNLGVNYYMAQSPDAHIIAPKNEEWAIEFVEPNEGFKKKQKASVAYKLAQHSRKELEYNFENMSKDISLTDDIIDEKKPKDCEYLSTVILNNISYGVYRRRRDGLIWIGKAEQRAGVKVEALDIASYANSNVTLLVKQWRGNAVLEIIFERFLVKRVKFMDRDTARAFMQYLDFIPKR